MRLPFDHEHDLRERLGARYTLEGEQGRHVTFHDAILGVQRAQEAMRDENSARTQTLMGLPVHVPAEDIVGALQLLPAERDRLDTYERTLIESALDSGMSWSELATALGRSSRQAMQQRYRRVGGTRTWPTRRSGAAQDG